MTQEMVIQALTGIAFSDLRHYLQWGPAGVTLERSATLTPAQARVVKQIVQTVTKDGSTLRITLHDKIAALDKLARHLGLYQRHDPEDPWEGQGLVGLVEQARQELRDKLDALAAKARENGQGGEGG